MDITYSGVKERIENILKLDIVDRDELKNLHRQIEVYNAHKIIANQDDKPMKDLEFFIQSALFLMNLGNQNDWKLQLEAALGILENCPQN